MASPTETSRPFHSSTTSSEFEDAELFEYKLPMIWYRIRANRCVETPAIISRRRDREHKDPQNLKHCSAATRHSYPRNPSARRVVRFPMSVCWAAQPFRRSTKKPRTLRQHISIEPFGCSLEI